MPPKNMRAPMVTRHMWFSLPCVTTVHCYVLLCIAMPLGIVGSRDFQLCHSASQGLESRFMAHSYFHVSFRTAIGYSLDIALFFRRGKCPALIPSCAQK